MGEILVSAESRQRLGEGLHPEEIAHGTNVPNKICQSEEKAVKAIHSRIWGKSRRPARRNNNNNNKVQFGNIYILRNSGTVVKYMA